MTESVFQQEIKQSINNFFPRAFYHKFSDIFAPYSNQITTGKISTGLRFVAKKPFDCFMIMDGRAWAFELKQIKTESPFNTNIVKDHQVIGLTDWETAGGTSFILVNYRFEPEFGIISKVNTVFAISLANFLKMDKSVPYSLLKLHGTEVGNQRVFTGKVDDEGKQLKALVWDIRSIIIPERVC